MIPKYEHAKQLVVGVNGIEPKWVDPQALRALHRRHLAEHGGPEGIRDEGMLESALARLKHRWHYHPGSRLAELAAAYAFGIAGNHPFVDGNQRTATVAMLLFLALNGQRLKASEDELYDQFLGLASGEIDEDGLAEQLGCRVNPR